MFSRLLGALLLFIALVIGVRAGNRPRFNTPLPTEPGPDGKARARNRRHPRGRRLAALTIVASLAFTGWHTFELFREPKIHSTPAEDPYGRPGKQRDVFLPFTIARESITRFVDVDLAPDALHLSMMTDLQHFRSRSADITLQIDEAEVTLAERTLVLQSQRRNSVQYNFTTLQTRIFPVDEPPQLVTTMDGTDVYGDGDASYLFAGDALERIKSGGTEIIFEPALDVTTTSKGTFRIVSDLDRGEWAGNYTVRSEGTEAELKIRIDKVALPKQRDIGQTVLFRLDPAYSWPKNYRYDATFDLETATGEARWTNIAPGK